MFYASDTLCAHDARWLWRGRGARRYTFGALSPCHFFVIITSFCHMLRHSHALRCHADALLLPPPRRAISATLMLLSRCRRIERHVLTPLLLRAIFATPLPPECLRAITLLAADADVLCYCSSAAATITLPPAAAICRHMRMRCRRCRHAITLSLV